MNENEVKNLSDKPISTHSKSLVSKTIQFDGNIKGNQDLIIEGTVEGTIMLIESNVTVAKTGLVRGDITAKTILVEGEVRGEMRGTEVVEIAPSGVVNGDIRAPRVMLQDGCQFKGLVDMDHKDTGSSDRKRPPQPVSPAMNAMKKPVGLKPQLKIPTLPTKH
ncbi:MAG: polymer-forming cytoskeletal protein [Arenicellales bacterium]